MKADERHRLAENELAKGLNRLRSASKRPPNILMVMIGLLAIVMVVYWYWSSTASSRVAKAWQTYFQTRDGGDVSEGLKKGPAGTAVQLTQSDAAYSRAYDQLFTNPQHALKDFVDVAQQYAELSNQASNNDIQLRALIGAGRAYENTANLDEAKKYYASIITKFGDRPEWKDHPLVKEARTRQDNLASANSGLANLYATWDAKMKQVTTEPKPPSLPEIPLPPIPVPGK